MENEKFTNTAQKQLPPKEAYKRHIGDIIALSVIVPVLALALYAKLKESEDRCSEFFTAVKNGELFDTGFFVLLGIMAVIAAVICLIFRKRETKKSKLISGAICASAGIVMTGMLIAMCVKAL